MFARVMGARPMDRQAIEQQLARLVASPGLQHSEALCLLLRYLVTESLDKPQEHIKEYQIALDVLGRPDSFDPHLDSAVRVQTSRLRNKLIEYYAAAGSEDRVLIEIPKGCYSPLFHERHPEPFSDTANPRNETRTAGPVRARHSWIWGLTILTGILLASLVVAAIVARPKIAAPGNDPLAVFWQSFLDRDAEPLVVFSNAEFVGRPETGLRYYAPGRDSPGAVFDHYTGVGEVLSVHELDQLFRHLNQRSQVKRGRLLNWDDARSRDLIFVGSPSENLSLREVPLGREFRFQIMQGPPRQGDLGILNLHPAPGESAVYFASQQVPISEDYALVELLRDAIPAHSVLLLAGTTTFGTEGAAEFACNEERIRELLPRLRGGDGRLKEFSALLQVKVNRGVPIETRMVALRTR